MKDNSGNDVAPRNPQIAAQEAMRPKLPTRFYKEVSVSEHKDGKFAIHLDGKQVKTPARNILILPARNTAQIVADEWNAQKDRIDPAKMPATRLVNTACDAIAHEPQPVIEDMLKFASSDLLCYRAFEPDGLVELQTRYWDPVLDWAAEELAAHFETTQGLVQIVQPKAAVAALSQTVRQWPDPIQIAALHTFTNLTGSLILALAIASKHLDAAQAWKIAHVDEDWNTERWGEDYEAKKRLESRWVEFQAAHRLFISLT
ncbi:MAG: ATPase [Rhizobiaceae bacterium]|nr:ATPase [Rhizobiaceae bacterium]